MSDSHLQRLRNCAKDLGTRAINELLSEEQRSEALGMAAKGMQQGRRVLDEKGGQILNTLGLATQPDLERVTRKIGRLRKRLHGLLDDLEHAA